MKIVCEFFSSKCCPKHRGKLVKFVFLLLFVFNIFADRLHAYISNNLSNTISIYKIESTGSLTPFSQGPVKSNVIGTGGIAIDPTGKFMYVIGSQSNTITVFSINSDLTLTELPSLKVNTCTQPLQLLFNPSSQYVYLDCQAKNLINLYIRNQDTGQLTFESCTPSPLGVSSIALNVTGQYFYAIGQQSNSISVYKVNGGALESLSFPPVGTGITPGGLHFDNFGHAYIYNNLNNTISIYTVDNNSGKLFFDSSVSTGVKPVWFTFDPTGKYAYVVNSAENTISMYSHDNSTGKLTPLNPPMVATGITPFSIAFDNRGHAYVTNQGQNSITLYSIGEETGILTKESEIPINGITPMIMDIR